MYQKYGLWNKSKVGFFFFVKGRKATIFFEMGRSYISERSSAVMLWPVLKDHVMTTSVNGSQLAKIEKEYSSHVPAINL